MFTRCVFPLVTGITMLVAVAAVAEPPAEADPALSDWVGEILQHNPELQAAQAAVDAAGGLLRAADQPLFNPELEFDYENSEIDTTTGGVSQAIDWSDKRAARAAVAGFELEGARAEFHSRRQRLAADLLQALADWHTTGAVLRVSEKQVLLMSHFADLAERRRKAGDLGQVELDLAHLAAAEAALDQANAYEDLLRAQQSLAVLTGADENGRPAFPEQLPKVDPQRIDVTALLNALPAIRSAQSRVAAERAAVQLRVREKRPDPTLGFRVGQEDSETLTGITLSVPLYVRNNFSAEVDVANASLIQAQREAASHWRQSRADLVATAQIYKNARRAWDNWNASGAPRLGQRTDLLNRLWQAGELNTTDYLVQLKQALDTEVSAIEQRGRMLQAWAAWLAASGRVEQWLNLAGDKS